ncbi:glycerol kinase GlpK [Beijerinckia sp. L45]|uniref:glycerol kinase GlpK n=1 Tax=Beijerinckia sp. L45 TaxID=1641855 RepID=UPI00131C5F0A|nr:glycerol kinase GlpK [Beijerinckia sp. L45]
MSGPRRILAIDQGTTSTRSMVFDAAAIPIAIAQREFPQHYPRDGWVEHDPEDIWRDTLATMREAMAGAGGDRTIEAIGIANQRETVVLWDRASGQAVYNAIVWQDRRTAKVCAALKAAGAEALVRARTGLLLDPYFSATKLGWLLDELPGVRARAERGELAFGTIDTFLLYRLTGGRVHLTDATNASRTLLFDIHRQRWDDDLLRLFHIPAAILPGVCDNSFVFGETDKNLFGRSIPIAGMAGDQQAAMIGQTCFAAGLAKATYGTGCFMLLNTGETPVLSNNRMLTTTAYRLDGKPIYALEGAIFVAGAAVKWLRDGVGVITDASQTHDMATAVADNNGVYMVPGFVGLGAPHWDPDARGLICGLTFSATAAHLARAALESVAYQTLDLAQAMASDGAGNTKTVRVDGGMAANDWFCQFLADMLQVDVERPHCLETTALGAAFLAGLATGLWPDTASLAATWRCERLFRPRMAAAPRAAMIKGWRTAVRRSLLREELG